tara:strand:+ start:334 stop:1047 length:714 start_codon:yes stop_codon:yes gene_type:complete
MKSINHILDASTPFEIVKYYLSSYSKLIDIYKFGWGSSLIDPEFEKKKDYCDKNDIIPVLGGTMFEYFYYKKKLITFKEYLKSHDLKWVELSRGTIDISDEEYYELITEYSEDFNVMSEVGRKNDNNLPVLTSKEWLNQSLCSIKAGAKIVILESRESGKAGIANADGSLKKELLNDLLSELDLNMILFEAPTKQIQSYLINNYGSEVNLGNINLQNILPVHALRKKLRSDTLIGNE